MKSEIKKSRPSAKVGGSLFVEKIENFFFEKKLQTTRPTDQPTNQRHFRAVPYLYIYLIISVLYNNKKVRASVFCWLVGWSWLVGVGRKKFEPLVGGWSVGRWLVGKTHLTNQKIPLIINELSPKKWLGWSVGRFFKNITHETKKKESPILLTKFGVRHRIA